MPAKIIRAQFRFDENLEGVAIRDAGYITSVSTSGEIVRTHEEPSVDTVGLVLLSYGATMTMGTKCVKIDFETERIYFECREEKRWSELTLPFDGFSFYNHLFDKFDPIQIPQDQVRLQHFYHGERSMGLPHGDGIGMWPSGAVFVGRWCNGRPTFDCGFGIAHDGSMRWGSRDGTITLATNGVLSFSDECGGRLVNKMQVMPSFRRIPVHSVFRTHFSHWRTFSKRIASERMMRSLILSETKPIAPAASGKRSKKKNRNRRRNVREEQTCVPDVATVDEEEEATKVDEQEEATKVDEEEEATKVDEEEEAMCVICLENLRSHAIVPCGHMCLCQDCASIVTESCPMCREPMVLAMRIYA